MAATYTVLIAVRWNRYVPASGKANYEVASEIEAEIDLSKLKADGLLHKANENSFYVDKAAVIAKRDLPKYFIIDGRKKSEAEKWYSKLDDYVMFILVHEAEFETGMDS
jgi:hypothetical protein